ncbi:MAG: hypothetical protein JW973_03290 [Bacteroidales bacterium]|nr:hypothetical protein [Bacteroidales bacterium]
MGNIVVKIAGLPEVNWPRLWKAGRASLRKSYIVHPYFNRSLFTIIH